MRNWFLIALLLASTAAAADTLTITGDNLTVKDSTGKVVYPPVVPPPPTAPVVTISTLGANTTQAQQTITGTIDAADVAAAITVFDNGQQSATATPTPNGSWSASITMSGLGTHSITASATNAAGTGTSAAIVFNLQAVSGGPTPPAPVTIATSAANAQTQLNAVPAGGSLVIPAGMTVGALRCKAGVTIWADGIVNVTGNFDCSGLSGWTVRGKAPGQGFVFNATRVNATGASNFAVGNNVFNNQPSNGFDGSGVQMNGASFGTIINNDFNNSQGNVLGMFNLDNITTDGNHFINCRQPLSIQEGTSTSTGRNIKVLRSVFVGTTRAAMEMGPSSTTREYFTGIVVDSNYFDNFNYSPNPDNFSALLAISLVGQASINTTVTNNFIRLGPAMRGHGAAIEFTGTGEAKNNVIWGWNFAGFTYQFGWNVHDNKLYQTNINFFANSPSGGPTYTGTFSNNVMLLAAPPDPGWPARISW